MFWEGGGQGREVDQAMFMVSVKSWVNVQHSAFSEAALRFVKTARWRLFYGIHVRRQDVCTCFHSSLTARLACSHRLLRLPFVVVSLILCVLGTCMID